MLSSVITYMAHGIHLCLLCSFLLYLFSAQLSGTNWIRESKFSLECSSYKFDVCVLIRDLIFYFLSISNGISFINDCPFSTILYMFLSFFLCCSTIFFAKTIGANTYNNSVRILNIFAFDYGFALLSYRLRYSTCVFVDCG